MKYAKYIHVLHYLNQHPNGSEMTTEETNKVADDLFKYLNENWPIPSNAITYVKGNSSKLGRSFTLEEKEQAEQLSQLFKTDIELISEKLEQIPPYFDENLFPAAVTRYMFQHKQWYIDHRQCPEFIKFLGYRRYQMWGEDDEFKGPSNVG